MKKYDTPEICLLVWSEEKILADSVESDNEVSVHILVNDLL